MPCSLSVPRFLPYSRFVSGVRFSQDGELKKVRFSSQAVAGNLAYICTLTVTGEKKVKISETSSFY